MPHLLATITLRVLPLDFAPSGLNMTEQRNQGSSPHSQVLYGALYWRKSWFSPRCPPAILYYSGGFLRLETADEVLFDAPIAQVNMKITAMKSMILTVEGRRIVVVGSAGVAARALNARQLERLSVLAKIPGAFALNSTAPALYANVGRSGITFGADGTQLGAIQRGAVSSAALVQRWATALRAQGVREHSSTPVT